VICGFCVTLFLLVCFICILEIFMPRVSSLQSLTLGTSVLSCGLSEQHVSGNVAAATQWLLIGETIHLFHHRLSICLHFIIGPPLNMAVCILGTLVVAHRYV